MTRLCILHGVFRWSRQYSEASSIQILLRGEIRFSRKCFLFPQNQDRKQPYTSEKGAFDANIITSIARNNTICSVVCWHITAVWHLFIYSTDQCQHTPDTRRNLAYYLNKWGQLKKLNLKKNHSKVYLHEILWFIIWFITYLCTQQDNICCMMEYFKPRDLCFCEERELQQMSPCFTLLFVPNEIHAEMDLMGRRHVEREIACIHV